MQSTLATAAVAAAQQKKHLQQNVKLPPPIPPHQSTHCQSSTGEDSDALNDGLPTVCTASSTADRANGRSNGYNRHMRTISDSGLRRFNSFNRKSSTIDSHSNSFSYKHKPVTFDRSELHYLCLINFN